MAPARYETEMTAEPIRTEGDWLASWLSWTVDMGCT